MARRIRSSFASHHWYKPTSRPSLEPSIRPSLAMYVLQRIAAAGSNCRCLRTCRPTHIPNKSWLPSCPAAPQRLALDDYFLPRLRFAPLRGRWLDH